MSQKKLLIISYSAGAGHVRAAEAIKKTAEQEFKHMQVKHVDFVDYSRFPIGTAVVDSYDLVIKQAPDLWGFFYHQTNKPTVSKYLKRVTKLMKNINSSRFIEDVVSFKPDYILFTHFIPADIYLALLEHNEIPLVPFGTLVTDYGLHELWMTSDMQEYFVPTEKMRWQVTARGINKKQVIESGIPVDPIFYHKKTRAEARMSLGLPKKGKIILCLSGGQGMMRLDDVVRVLSESQERMTIIAVAGKNERLYNRVAKLVLPPHIKLIVKGWIDPIDDYMRAADIVVSKLGGMTTTECMSLGLPIVGVDPIPGQEEHNTEFILEEQRGNIARTKEDLLYYLSHPCKPATPLRTFAARKILKHIAARKKNQAM